MPKLSRRKLLALGVPLAAAPLAGRLAFGSAAADASDHRMRSPALHEHGMPAAGHAAMIGEQAPAVGEPGDLDDLLYPPRPIPYQPGRVREYHLSAVDRDIEVAPGVTFSAWTSTAPCPGR